MQEARAVAVKAMVGVNYLDRPAKIIVVDQSKLPRDISTYEFDIACNEQAQRMARIKA